MASDALFLELAKARAQPSRAAREATSAIDAVGGTIGAYKAQKDAQTAEAIKKAAVLDNFAKLADSVGYNKASQIFPFQQLGLDPNLVAKTYKPQGMPSPDTSTGGPLALNGSNPSPSLPNALGSGAMAPSDTPDLTTQYRNGDLGANQLDRELKLRQNELQSQQNSPATFDQVDQFFRSAGKPEIGQSLIESAKRSGKSVVQKDIFDKATQLVGPKSDIADALNKRTDLQVANAINHNVNALTGSGALGQSGKNNLRLARIQPLLEKQGPLTPQELERVNTDIDGVITGGVPLRSTEEGQKISTISTEIARLRQQFGNNPAAFNDAGFRKRIVPLVNGLIAADNEVQDRAFSMVKANYGHLTTPEHLSRVRDAMRTGQQLPIIDVQGGGTPGGEIPGGGTGDPEADAAIQQILSSNASTQKKQAGISAIRARTTNGR